MSTEPAPPVITITNPSAPAPLSDVIGTDAKRPPRRMRPAQKRLAWLTAAIVATGAAGVWTAGHLRAAERLDKDALREVSVVPVTSELSSGDGNHVELALVSQGPHPVSIVSAQLDSPGYPELKADKNTLQPNNPSVLSFPLPSACPATLSLAYDAAVLVRVRTYRGDDTIVRLVTDPTSTSFAQGFLYTTMTRCGLYPPEFSIALADRPTVERPGTALRLTLRVHNLSRDPRSIVSLEAHGGLLVVGSTTPVELAGHAEGEVQVTLRVTDCATALGSWAFASQQQGFTPTFQVVSADGELDVHVNGDGQVGLTASLLTPADTDEVGIWVIDRCPR